jgi:hypothetical protein
MGVTVDVAVGVGLGVNVSVVLGDAVGVGTVVFSSSPPPQAGEIISNNKLKAVNATNHSFMFFPPSLLFVVLRSFQIYT